MGLVGFGTTCMLTSRAKDSKSTGRLPLMFTYHSVGWTKSRELVLTIQGPKAKIKDETFFLLGAKIGGVIKIHKFSET